MALSMEDLEFAFKLGGENMVEKIQKIISLDNEELLPFEPDGHNSSDAYKEMALEEQLEEIYETVVGDSGRDRFSHGELIQVLKDLYDDSKVLQNIDDYRSK